METSAVSVVETLQPLITALTNAISGAEIVAILAACVGISIPLYLVWFGARKGISALKKGARGKLGV